MEVLKVEITIISYEDVNDDEDDDNEMNALDGDDVSTLPFLFSIIDNVDKKQKQENRFLLGRYQCLRLSSLRLPIS